MNPSAFLSLQQIDSLLDAVANKRGRLPEAAVAKDRESALAAHHANMAATQRRIDVAQEAIDAAEHANTELTTKRTRLEGQLKTVIAPREAEALMHEIEIINTHRSELDDVELAALDEQGDAEATYAELLAGVTELEAQVAQAQATLQAVNQELDTELADLSAQREAAVAELAPADLALYQRVRTQFGGVGVARLEGTHCSGCHMELSPREIDQVKAVAADQLAECPQCGRILAR